MSVLIAARIKAGRKAHDNLSLEALATRSGIHPKALGRIEEGNRVPSGAMLRALTEALELPEDALTRGGPVWTDEQRAEARKLVNLFISVDIRAQAVTRNGKRSPSEVIHSDERAEVQRIAAVLEADDTPTDGNWRQLYLYACIVAEPGT